MSRLTYAKRTRLAAAVGAFLGLGLAGAPSWASIAGNGSSSEIALLVWDTSTGNGYIRDLGNLWTLSTLSTVFSTSKSFAADTKYADFLTLNGGLTSSTVWSVVGATNATDLITVKPSYSYLTQGYPNYLAATNGQNFITITQLEKGSQGNTSLNTSQVIPANLGATYWANWSLGFNSQDNNTTGHAISSTLFPDDETTMNFFELNKTPGPTHAAEQQIVTKLAGTWTFNTATGGLNYTVSEAPEPQTVSMMLVGVMALGLLTRKRPGRND